MSVGLIGTVLLQIHWFREAIQLELNSFDGKVYEALNKVEERLSLKEKKSSIDMLELPKFLQEEVDVFMQESDAVRRNVFKSMDALIDSSYKNESFKNLLNPVDDTWRNRIRNLEMSEQARSRSPIENRVNPKNLTIILDQELKNHGIDLEFQHGVFSNKDKSFVVLNDAYTVGAIDQDFSKGPTDAYSLEEKTLYGSPYQVELFRSDGSESPGLLKVHFPFKNSLIWQNLIPILISTILFTLLILFCFSYTVHVIFRQKKVSEMKTDFINNMTHEFKTPIATISLAADSITSPIVRNDEKKVNRFADIIKQENKRMLSQVEKVLQMALIDKKDFQLKLTQVDMHKVIDQAVEHANLQISKRGGVIRKFLTAELSDIEGDHTHLANIISNLLDNANKYSPEVPEISVHTRNVNGGIEVIIEDKGIGMSKEARKHIFDKFYRVHTGNLHDVKGFGLGLSYVKAITDAHSGNINVSSELGKGSSFILYFPSKHKHSAA
ncbi:MAG: HAMP domain-containing histidine kinase [Saprospiraceae bacterium]|nr:HAMP domain-containing histidine kinase [Saprospiraceae bacterium]